MASHSFTNFSCSSSFALPESSLMTTGAVSVRRCNHPLTNSSCNLSLPLPVSRRCNHPFTNSSCILSLPLPVSIRRCKRRTPVFCSAIPLPDSRSLMELRKDVSPSVVEILSYFAGPANREIPHSASRCTGVFVDPTLILTSARVIGRVSTVYNSEHASIVNKCYIAKTVALTIGEKMLYTVPLAIDFAGDVAVLEVIRAEGKLPPPCAVADDVAEHGSRVLGIVRHGSCTMLMLLQVAKNMSRPKAPWPLNDEVDWVDYGCGGTNERVSDALPNMMGSPWFNYQGEVVGMVSWSAAYRKFNGFAMETAMYSYAASPARIRFVVEHAKMKGPDDPIVMDPHIDNLILPDFDSNVVEGCVPKWAKNVSLTMMLANSMI